MGSSPSFEPITTERMFSTLKVKRREPSGQPITKITTQLDELDIIIWKELGKGVRTPEGVRGWVGRKRRELEAWVRELAIRDVLDYFRGEAIVRNHTPNNIIVQHCISIDFISKVGNSEAEIPP